MIDSSGSNSEMQKFESSRLSHAVGLSQVRSPAIVMHRVALDGHEIHGGHADSKRLATGAKHFRVDQFNDPGVTGAVRFVSGSGVFVNDGGRQHSGLGLFNRALHYWESFFSGMAFSDDRSPAREAAMAAFAKSWRRELKESPGCAGASRPTKGDTP
jgi:hypothetical protein